MSQYPSPYQTPGYPPNLGYYAASPDLLAPARKAGNAMLAFASLTLLLGACNTISSLVTPAQQVYDRQKQMFPGSLAQMPLTADQLRQLSLGLGITTLVAALLMFALAAGVRRGSKWVTILSIVITLGLMLFVGLMMLAFLIAGLAAPAILLMALLPALPLALLIWQLVCLIRAARAASAVAIARQQYQMQYWQYQQNLQAAQSGGGYGYSTPPPASPPPQT